MKILVGAATKADIIKDSILKINDLVFTHTGKNGMYMVYECDNPDDKNVVDIVKQTRIIYGVFQRFHWKLKKELRPHSS